MDHGLEELINLADTQLRLAKRAGKNRSQIAFDPKSAMAPMKIAMEPEPGMGASR